MRKKTLLLTNKSFAEYGVENMRDLWQKAQEAGYTSLQTSLVATFTKSADDDNTYHAILSDAIQDRHGDVVKQKWELTNFRKNPVLLDSHNYHSIEAIIGRWKSIKVEDDTLQGDIIFAVETSRGALAKYLVDGGFLTALSAGFIPLEFDKDGIILKSELLEGSMVSVPANPRSLIEKSQDAADDDSQDDTQVEEDIVEEDAQEEEEVIEAKRKSLTVALAQKIKAQDNIIRAVAREMDGMNEKNVHARKRSIWQSIREAL
jgi:HK97 family phage prohead protease